MMGYSFSFGVLLMLLVALVLSAFRILREYERGVVFQLGRFWKVKGPGLILVIPGLQQMVRVDLRTLVLDVPTQDVISRDNVSVKVNAVIYYRVLDAQKAIIQVEDYHAATSQLAQTTLRSVLGKHELDDMLAEREQLNTDIQQVLDAQTDAGASRSPMWRSSTSTWTNPWCAPSPDRPRPNGSGAPRSSTPRANCRPRKNSCRPPRCWPASPAPCSCATCRP